VNYENSAHIYKSLLRPTLSSMIRAGFEMIELLLRDASDTNGHNTAMTERSRGTVTSIQNVEARSKLLKHLEQNNGQRKQRVAQN
jgi:hypothetical protein